MPAARFRHRSRVFCAVLFAAFSMPACADDISPALDRVSLWLGGYSLDAKVALAARAGDVETGNVNLDSGHENVGRARFDFLFLDNQGFTFDYYTLDRSKTQLLDKPFTYDGMPFQLDSDLHGKFDLAAGSASYHWWFGGADDVVGVGIGGTYYKLKLGINGTVTLNDIAATGAVSWEDDAVAPLITLAYKHAFSDSLRVYVDTSGVKKNGGKLTGHIYDGRVGIEWFPWRNFGFGAEYGVTHIRLDHAGSSYDANLDFKLDGPSLFARARF
jgi:hypothetical protein